MVDHFQDCEFWLPPEFLNDDDFDFNLKKDGSDLFSGFGFSGTNSEINSPGESVISSTESDTDEDDYVTGLTRKMAASTLGENNKAWGLSSSPNSPLCNAAGEFDWKKMVQESSPNGCFPKNSPPQLCSQQLQAMRFEQYRRNQMMPQPQQNRGVKNGEKMPMGLPVSAWPPLQRSQPKPQPGTSMTAVFLGNNHGGGKKPCAGTGVFLPRSISSTGNHKNKPGCTPVFIPDRVVKALNLNLETLGVQNQAHLRPVYYNNNGSSADYGAALKYINKNKKNHEMVQRQSIAKEVEAENPQVMQLPPEWTY